MRLGRSRRRSTVATVSIHVRDVAQLLNSLDPSPFWDRDLDRDAARYIEDEFTDRLRADRWHLHIYARQGIAAATDLPAAIGRYYARLAASVRMQLHEEMRVGQIALGAGLAVFAICMSLRGLLRNAWTAMPTAIDEGLIVLGWIALWRPIEVLAYGWVPLYRRRRLYSRLAAVHVTVKEEAAGSTPPIGADTIAGSTSAVS